MVQPGAVAVPEQLVQQASLALLLALLLLTLRRQQQQQRGRGRGAESRGVQTTISLRRGRGLRPRLEEMFTVPASLPSLPRLAPSLTLTPPSPPVLQKPQPTDPTNLLKRPPPPKGQKPKVCPAKHKPLPSMSGSPAPPPPPPPPQLTGTGTRWHRPARPRPPAALPKPRPGTRIETPLYPAAPASLLAEIRGGVTLRRTNVALRAPSGPSGRLGRRKSSGLVSALRGAFESWGRGGDSSEEEESECGSLDWDSTSTSTWGRKLTQL